MALKVISKNEYEEKLCFDYDLVYLEYWTEDRLISNNRGFFLMDVTTYLSGLLDRVDFSNSIHDEIYILDKQQGVCYSVLKCPGRLCNRNDVLDKICEN